MSSINENSYFDESEITGIVKNLSFLVNLFYLLRSGDQNIGRLVKESNHS